MVVTPARWSSGCIVGVEALSTVILLMAVVRPAWAQLRCLTLWSFVGAACLFRAQNLFFALLVMIGWTSMTRRDGVMGWLSAVNNALLWLDLGFGLRPNSLGSPCGICMPSFWRPGWSLPVLLPLTL